MEQKKLKKSTLMKSYLNWSFFHLTSLGFERMEAFGFLHSMLPIIKELYGDDKEEEIKALKRHSVFQNVEPILGSVVPGIVAALEENRANGAEIDDGMINGVDVYKRQVNDIPGFRLSICCGCFIRMHLNR